MIGDLEALGISHEHLFYWGQFSSRGLAGVAMRYKRNWQFYDGGGVDLALSAKAVDVYPEDCAMQGRESLVDAVGANLRACHVTRTRDCRYCRLPLGSPLPASSASVRRATTADMGQLVRLYQDAGEMQRDADSIRSVLNHGRIFVTEVQNRHRLGRADECRDRHNGDDWRRVYPRAMAPPRVCHCGHGSALHKPVSRPTRALLILRQPRSRRYLPPPRVSGTWRVAHGQPGTPQPRPAWLGAGLIRITVSAESCWIPTDPGRCPPHGSG